MRLLPLLAILLLTMSTPAQARFDSLFRHYGGERWQWFKAQAMAESAMNPRARSHVGAEGLTQFMPATWLEVMGDDPQASPQNPEDSIKAQVRYMDRLLKVFEGDWRKSFAAYNCGPGRVARLVAKHGEGWFEKLPEETRGYVPRIERYYEQYKKGDA